VPKTFPTIDLLLNHVLEAILCLVIDDHMRHPHTMPYIYWNMD